MATTFSDPAAAIGGYNIQPSWGAGSAAYGGVPAPASPQAAQGSAILGNLSNVGSIYNLATGIGGASGAGGISNLGTALPGAPAAQQTALGVIGSDLAGNLSPSTLNNLQQMAAERGVSTGSPGSPNSNAALMALLGQTTESLQQTGLQDLNALTAAAPVGPSFNPATQLVDPNAQLEQSNFNNALAAAPNPSAAAAANLAALNAGRAAGGSTGPVPMGGGRSGATLAAPGNSYPFSMVSGPAGGTVGPAATGTINDIPGTNFYGDSGNGLFGGTGMFNDTGMFYGAPDTSPSFFDTIGQGTASDQAATDPYSGYDDYFDNSSYTPDSSDSYDEAYYLS